MTTNDSESEIAGRLGASLTPSVPRIAVQHRGEQSSGLFDIGAMYAASVEQVMRRARTVREPPVLEFARSARTAQGSPLHAWARTPDPQRAIEIDFESEQLSQPVARTRGVGWFGVAVAWLATTAIGATVATTLPAHTVPRVVPALAAVATAPVVTSTPAPAPAPPPSPGVIPTGLAVVASPAPVLAPDPAPAAAPKKPNAAPHPRTSVTPRPLTAEVAAPIAQSQKAAAPTASSPAKATATTSPQAAGGSSLEDLMRRAVEADSKHH